MELERGYGGKTRQKRANTGGCVFPTNDSSHHPPLPSHSTPTATPISQCLVHVRTQPPMDGHVDTRERERGEKGGGGMAVLGEG